MEDEKLLDEYILNETGRIWVGTSQHFRGRPWNFGQVSGYKESLETSL